MSTLMVKYLSVPKEFTFRVKCFTSNCDLLHHIRIFYTVFDITEENIALLKSGISNIGKFKVFIYNQEKQGYIDIYFENEDSYKELLDEIQNKREKRNSIIKHKIYRYNLQQNYWYISDSFTNSNISLIGHDKFLNTVYNDLDNHNKYNEYLKSIGEMKSINYLLYGPPGVGKTTMIRVIATQKDIPIFIVNPNTISYNNIDKILSPNTIKGLKILLFEDFDRFLENEKISDIMSEILNALDGFNDNGDTIRFFTANNIENVINCKALYHRISQSFQFKMPENDIFRNKLLYLLKYHEETIDIKKVNIFLDSIKDIKITLRPFTSYVIRYMFNKNYLDDMIENIRELQM